MPNTFLGYLNRIATHPSASYLVKHRSLPLSHDNNTRISGPASFIIPGITGGTWRNDISVISLTHSNYDAAVETYASGSKLSHKSPPFLPIWYIILAGHYLSGTKTLQCSELTFSTGNGVGIVLGNSPDSSLVQRIKDENPTTKFFPELFNRDAKTGNIFTINPITGNRDLIEWPKSVITSKTDEKILEEMLVQEYKGKMKKLDPEKSVKENARDILGITNEGESAQSEYDWVLRPIVHLIENHWKENPSKKKPASSPQLPISENPKMTINDGTDPYSLPNY